VNVHWVIKAFINLMWPFVDPVTKKKVRFCNTGDIVKSGEIAPEVLLKECGGDLDVVNVYFAPTARSGLYLNSR
jgi:hypothetical protein